MKKIALINFILIFANISFAQKKLFDKLAEKAINIAEKEVKKIINQTPLENKNEGKIINGNIIWDDILKKQQEFETLLSRSIKEEKYILVLSMRPDPYNPSNFSTELQAIKENEDFLKSFDNILNPFFETFEHPQNGFFRKKYLDKYGGSNDGYRLKGYENRSSRIFLFNPITDEIVHMWGLGMLDKNNQKEDLKFDIQEAIKIDRIIEKCKKENRKILLAYQHYSGSISSNKPQRVGGVDLNTIITTKMRDDFEYIYYHNKREGYDHFNSRTPWDERFKINSVINIIDPNTKLVTTVDYNELINNKSKVEKELKAWNSNLDLDFFKNGNFNEILKESSRIKKPMFIWVEGKNSITSNPEIERNVKVILNDEVYKNYIKNNFLVYRIGKRDEEEPVLNFGNAGISKKGCFMYFIGYNGDGNILDCFVKGVENSFNHAFQYVNDEVRIGKEISKFEGDLGRGASYDLARKRIKAEDDGITINWTDFLGIESLTKIVDEAKVNNKKIFISVTNHPNMNKIYFKNMEVKKLVVDKFLFLNLNINEGSLRKSLETRLKIELNGYPSFVLIDPKNEDISEYVLGNKVDGTIYYQISKWLEKTMNK